MHNATYDDLTVVTLEDLKRLSTLVSLEANGAFFADTRARFGQFFAKADSFFKNVSFQALGIGKVNIAPLSRYVQKQGFVNAAKASVIVPNGFTGHWLPFAEDLVETLRVAVQLPKALEQFNVAIGQLISDPGLLKSASGIAYQTDYPYSVADKMVNMAKAYFDPNLEQTSRELGAVLERQADLPKIEAALNQLLFTDKTNPASNVVKQVDRTMELAKRLLPVMDSDPLTSKAVKEQMIAITYSLATEVEAYATLLVRIRTLVLAVEDSGKELAKS